MKITKDNATFFQREECKTWMKPHSVAFCCWHSRRLRVRRFSTVFSAIFCHGVCRFCWHFWLHRCWNRSCCICSGGCASSAAFPRWSWRWRFSFSSEGCCRSCGPRCSRRWARCSPPPRRFSTRSQLRRTIFFPGWSASAQQAPNGSAASCTSSFYRS